MDSFNQTNFFSNASNAFQKQPHDNSDYFNTSRQTIYQHPHLNFKGSGKFFHFSDFISCSVRSFSKYRLKLPYFYQSKL